MLRTYIYKYIKKFKPFKIGNEEVYKRGEREEKALDGVTYINRWTPRVSKKYETSGKKLIKRKTKSLR